MAEAILFLTFVGGPRDRQSLRFDRAVVSIGRDPASDVAFDPFKEIEVSATHATVRRVQSGFAIEDTSRNGTYINGDRVRERVTLAHGDLVQLGTSGPVLRIGIGKAAPAVAVAQTPKARPGAPIGPSGAPPQTHPMPSASLGDLPQGDPFAPISGAVQLAGALADGAPDRAAGGAEDLDTGLDPLKIRLPPRKSTSAPLPVLPDRSPFADDDEPKTVIGIASPLRPEDRGTDAQTLGPRGFPAMPPQTGVGPLPGGIASGRGSALAASALSKSGRQVRPTMENPAVSPGQNRRMLEMPRTQMGRMPGAGAGVDSTASDGDLTPIPIGRDVAPLSVIDPDEGRPRLLVERLDGDGFIMELVGEVFKLGRDPRSEIAFDDEGGAVGQAVAYNHAKIIYYGGEYVLFDNDSPQKTFVDGKAVVRAPLKGGEVVTLGEGGPRLRLKPLPPKGAPAKATPKESSQSGTLAPLVEPLAVVTGLPSMQGSAAPAFDEHTPLPDGSARKEKEKRPTYGGKAIAQVAARAAAAAEPEKAAQRRAKARLLKEVPVFGQNVEIGRLGGLALTLDSMHVSNRHARLEWRKEGPGPEETPYIVDLGSANGTFVDGRQVSEHRLQIGDEVTIGPFFIEYVGSALKVYDVRQASVSCHNLVRRDSRTGRVFLDKVSLAVRPAEFVCLLGPSGSGKSTLLKTLSGAERAASGSVYVNDTDFYERYAQLKYQVGYVPQEDIVHPELTVRRTLQYAARLRLPRGVDKAAAQRRIDEVLSILELQDHADKPVKMLSGGQRKRVSIGVELLTEPGLLYLDEPTSGLDPNLEEKMMLLCRELSLRGNTVVCVTHVLDNIHLADKVGILYDGKLIFYGTPKEALKHFDVERMPEIYQRLDERRDAEALRQEYLESESYARHLAAEVLLLDDKSSSPDQASVNEAPRDKGGQQAGAGTIGQFFLLSRRYFEILTRDLKNTAILVLQAPIVALVICLAIPTSKLSRSPTSTLLLVLALSSLWFGCSNAAREITKEEHIFRRERMVSLRILPYVASKFFVLQLFSLVQCLIMQVIVFRFGDTPAMHLVGATPELWLLSLANLYLLSLTGIGLGLLISSFAGNSDKAMSLVPLILIPQILLSGGFGLFKAGQPVRPVAYAMSLNWALDSAKRIATCPLGEESKCYACLTPTDPYLEEADQEKLPPDLKILKEKLPSHCTADDQRTKSETVEVAMDGLYGEYRLAKIGKPRTRVEPLLGMGVVGGMAFLFFIGVAIALRSRDK